MKKKIVLKAALIHKASHTLSAMNQESYVTDEYNFIDDGIQPFDRPPSKPAALPPRVRVESLADLARLVAEHNDCTTAQALHQITLFAGLINQPSKREQAAMHAMQGLCSAFRDSGEKINVAPTAASAVTLADALLKELDAEVVVG